MSEGVTIEGVAAFKAKLKAIGKAYDREVQVALDQELGEIQEVSMDRTPVDRGWLKGSHERKVVKSGPEIKGTITVGGPAQEYAAAVHYRLEVKHANGQPLFLSSALDDAKPGLSKRLGDRIKRNTGLR